MTLRGQTQEDMTDDELATLGQELAEAGFKAHIAQLEQALVYDAGLMRQAGEFDPTVGGKEWRQQLDEKAREYGYLKGGSYNDDEIARIMGGDPGPSPAEVLSRHARISPLLTKLMGSSALMRGHMSLGVPSELE